MSATGWAMIDFSVAVLNLYFASLGGPWVTLNLASAGVMTAVFFYQVTRSLSEG